jgi:hypothetical protein
MCETLAPTRARWLAVSVALRFSSGCSNELTPFSAGSSGSSTQSSCLHSRSGDVVGSPANRCSSSIVARCPCVTDGARWCLLLWLLRWSEMYTAQPVCAVAAHSVSTCCSSYQPFSDPSLFLFNFWPCPGTLLVVCIYAALNFPLGLDQIQSAKHRVGGVCVIFLARSIHCRSASPTCPELGVLFVPK